MEMAVETGAAATSSPLPKPTIADLKEGETVVRLLQQMLGHMHAHKHNASPQFQEFMSYYKFLSSGLQKMRKIHQDDANQRAQLAKAARPAQGQVASSVLSRPRPAVPGPRVAPRGAIPPAAPAEHAPAGFETTEEVAAPAGDAVAVVEATISEIVHMAEPPPDPSRPLAMPKFAGTLGPPGSKAIDYGPPVANLQRLLAALGHAVNFTGEYDAKTYRAVQEFQIAHRLPVTGVVGLDTRRVLNGLVTG